MTPASRRTSPPRADQQLLLSLYQQYHAAVARLYRETCGGGGGLALALHSYAPRSVEVAVDADIVTALRAAYRPAVYGRWALAAGGRLHHPRRRRTGSLASRTGRGASGGLRGPRPRRRRERDLPPASGDDGLPLLGGLPRAGPLRRVPARPPGRTLAAVRALAGRAAQGRATGAAAGRRARRGASRTAAAR